VKYLKRSARGGADRGVKKPKDERIKTIRFPSRPTYNLLDCGFGRLRDKEAFVADLGRRTPEII